MLEVTSKPPVNGIDYYYEIHGKDGAPWLTFSHSLACSVRMWDGQVAEFKDRFRILVYDTRGHGGSEAPKGPYTLDMLAEDLSFDRAIDSYVRVMGLPEPMASVVATRTLVVLGEDLVPYRRRAQEAPRPDETPGRPPLRLNDASEGRFRAVRRA